MYDRKLATRPVAATLASFLDNHEGQFSWGCRPPQLIRRQRVFADGASMSLARQGTWIPEGMKETPPAGWKSVAFKTPPVPGGRIFFIEYINQDYWKNLEKKYPNLREDPAKKTHANGALGLHAAWMSVTDLDEATKAYEAVGLVAGATIPLPAIGATAREIRAGSNGTILLVSPAKPAGLTARFLSDRGESVMGVSIEVQSLAKTQSVLKTGLRQDLAAYSGP